MLKNITVGRSAQYRTDQAHYSHRSSPIRKPNYEDICYVDVQKGRYVIAQLKKMRYVM